MDLAEEDRADLREAIDRLRRSRGVVVRAADLLAGLLGPAAALGLRQLRIPSALIGKVQKLSEAALRRAFGVAVLGVTGGPGSRAFLRFSDRTGKLVAATSGAVSGLAGLLGFLPDVTLNTLLIMRRIASIAVEEGEDLSREEARAACLEVFAFDQPSSTSGILGKAEETDPELRYWTARLVLQGRPLMILVSEIAASYGIRISQKLSLQAAPVVGAAGAAIVNSVFLDHYQSLARAHFTIRRLERRYGTERVRAAWSELA
jgi:hypothetical protein